MYDYEITHSCGHIQSHKLFCDPNKDRAMLLRFSKMPCSLCRQAGKDVEKEPRKSNRIRTTLSKIREHFAPRNEPTRPGSSGDD